MTQYFKRKGLVDSYMKRKVSSNYSFANYFTWFLFLITLSSICICVWMTTLYVFNYPEKPFSYKVLKKIKKNKKLINYKRNNYPRGNFMNSEQVYNFFYTFEDKKLKNLNSIMLRNYLTNYTNKEFPPIYISDKFKIVQIRKLTNKDFFTEGLIVRARSMNYRELYIEYIFNGKNLNEKHFEINDLLKIEKTLDNSVIINTQKFNRYDICLTILSLNYRDYPGRLKSKFIVSPPKHININATLPITENTIGRVDKFNPN